MTDDKEVNNDDEEETEDETYEVEVIRTIVMSWQKSGCGWVGRGGGEGKDKIDYSLMVYDMLEVKIKQNKSQIKQNIKIFAICHWRGCQIS